MSGAGAFASGLAGGYFTGMKLDDLATRQRGRGVTSDGAAGSPSPELVRGVTEVVSPEVAASNPQQFTYDGAISDRVSHAYKRFTDAGLPSHVAAGLTGNLMQESGPEIDPAAVGDNGNAFGSPQWNGPRMRAYKAFAAEKGVDPTDFDTQIDYLLHEGKTTEKGAWDAILATQTADEAARVASEKFWRPGTPHLERRIGYATSVFDRFSAPEPTAAPTQTASVQPERGIEGLINKGERILDRFYRNKGSE